METATPQSVSSLCASQGDLPGNGGVSRAGDETISPWDLPLSYSLRSSSRGATSSLWSTALVEFTRVLSMANGSLLLVGPLALVAVCWGKGNREA